MYGIIPKNKEIDHIDVNKLNNNIKNLQLSTPKENMQRSHCKKLESSNTKTKEKKKASEELKICMSSIAKVCRKEQKTAKSKIDDVVYSFIYLA